MANSATIQWQRGKEPTSVWVPNTQRWSEALAQAVYDVVKAREDEVREWMKNNHVWKNRTHLAEEELDAVVRRELFTVVLYMFQGWLVYYSRFLEGATPSGYMQGGRFSVLRPAMDYWGAILLDDVRRKLS